MSTAIDDQILVDRAAYNHAFEAGQLLEELLVDRSVELAARSGCSVVTAEHVNASLDHTLLDHLLRQLRASSNGGAATDHRASGDTKREAA